MKSGIYPSLMEEQLVEVTMPSRCLDTEADDEIASTLTHYTELSRLLGQITHGELSFAILVLWI